MEIRNTWSKEGINIHYESFVILWLTVALTFKYNFIAGFSCMNLNITGGLVFS